MKYLNRALLIAYIAFIAGQLVELIGTAHAPSVGNWTVIEAAEVAFVIIVTAALGFLAGMEAQA